MNDSFYRHLELTLTQIRDDGFFKRERLIATPQNSMLRLESGAEVVNFCANNYLGLADDARLLAAAKRGLDDYGFGMASVRFICGTQTSHRDLEQHFGSARTQGGYRKVSASLLYLQALSRCKVQLLCRHRPVCGYV